MRLFWHSNCSFTHANFDLLQDKNCETRYCLFFHCFLSSARNGQTRMAMIRVAILLSLFIFGSIVLAWSDPAKSIKDGTNPFMTTKMEESRPALLKKPGPAKDAAESSKKSRAKFPDMNFLRTLEEKKRSQWVGSLDEVIYTLEFSENGRRTDFLDPRRAQQEAKSPRSDLDPATMRPYPDENGYLEERRMLKILRHLQLREEAFKEIFMGFRFSFDLTYGYLLLEMNVKPSSEKGSGILIRF